MDGKCNGIIPKWNLFPSKFDPWPNFSFVTRVLFQKRNLIPILSIPFSRFLSLLSIPLTVSLFVLFLDHSLGMLLMDFSYPSVLCERVENSGIEFSISFENAAFWIEFLIQSALKNLEWPVTALTRWQSFSPLFSVSLSRFATELFWPLCRNWQNYEAQEAHFRDINVISGISSDVHRREMCLHWKNVHSLVTEKCMIENR